MLSEVLRYVMVLELPGQKEVLKKVMALEPPGQEVQKIPLAQCLELQNILELLLQRQNSLGYQAKIDHERIFLFDHYSDVADCSYTEDYD